MPNLNDFREMINGINDKELLEAGQTLLREMMRINALKIELKALEDSLTEGGKAIFYFFAEELDEDEIVFATERISGRISRIEREEELKAEEKSLSEEKVAEANDAPCEEGEAQVK